MTYNGKFFKLANMPINNTNNLKNIPDILIPYINNPDISEIIINYSNYILIEESGVLYNTNHKLSDTEIKKILDFIMLYNNKNIGYTNPIFDGVFPPNIRCNVITYPLAKGPIITLRKKALEYIDFNTLVKNHTFPIKIKNNFLKFINNKSNILIAGGTNTGKTTLITAFINEINTLFPNQYIIIIEDIPEIILDNKPFIINLRASINDKATNTFISLGDLVKTTLRMRPDRIIVGEIRGEEAYYLLHALNTGHKGAITSIHANSAHDALKRLEILSILGHTNLNPIIPQKWIAANIDVIIFLEKKQTQRYIKTIHLLEGLDNGTYLLNEIYRA